MITVLGSSGFIGGKLCQRLKASGLEYYAPAREESLEGRDLGAVIYCIGLTADFRTRRLETAEAHVCKLLRVVRDCRFDSLLYLSSTRLYGHRDVLAREEDELSLAPLEADHLYNISKAMGESLVLNNDRRGRVARISNVYGEDFESENFLSTVIKDAVLRGAVTLNSAPDSEKDYVGVNHVVDALIEIATTGRHLVYNIASGTNVSNRALLERIAAITKCSVAFSSDARPVKFPAISVERMRQEFDFHPGNVLEELEQLISSYKSAASKIS
jgi:nucleoside-diphosphate-sugar epimerase